MRKLTYWLLLCFAVSVPWELVSLPGVGAISRLLGVAAMGAGALTVIAKRRIRRQGVVFWFAVGFTFSSFLSLLWTISYASTVDRVFTYAQLLGLVWLVPEFARTRKEQQAILVAICAGTFVPMIDLFFNFSAGIEIGGGNRYSSSSVNANDLGLTLALGIPIAWHLMLHNRGSVRWMAWIYLPLAPIAILLTGTRGAFVAALVALMIVPLTLPRISARSALLVAVLLLVGAGLTATVVPTESWERMMTIQDELAGEGTLTGRLDIWNAGWSVFQRHAALGVGAGAFPDAVEPLLAGSRSTAPHNVPLAILVEQGIVGALTFSALLAACGWIVVRLPPAERRLWGVLMLCWLVGVMSVGWQYRKLTWLFFALLAAQEGVRQADRPNTRSAGARRGHRRQLNPAPTAARTPAVGT